MLARVVDGVVVEIIDLPTDVSIASVFPAEIARALFECGSEVRPGWIYAGSEFSKPPEAEPVTAPLRLSFLEFIDLFTEQEQLAIAGAAMTDVATKLWYDRAVGAQFIDLGDARLVAGLQKMVDAKLLTSARRTRVLKGLMPA